MHLRLGTRQSRLALAQSGQVARQLEQRHPGLEVELVGLTTRGDTTPGPLAALGGKGLFTEELESGLLDGSLDLAVHSLKDLPVCLPQGLCIAAHPERADPRDALISRCAESVAALPEGARVLTGSLRRRAQLLRLRPDLAVEGVRGNVDTRLRKWRELGAGAVVLAKAGLDRLGLGTEEAPAWPVDPTELIPAPGQGTLALEVAEGSRAFELCQAIDDPDTRTAAAAERSLVAAFGADCTLPLAAWAVRTDQAWTVRGFVASRDGRRSLVASAHNGSAEQAAREVIERLEAQGARELLEADE
jgi:hydroxymethylbilane synthase